MPVTATPSTHGKYQLAAKEIDLAADALKISLMRSGCVFNRDLHGIYANIMGTLTRSDISFEAASGHIHAAGGNFITAGYVAGGKIAISGSAANDGTKTIATVDSAIQMTITEALLDESAGASVTARRLRVTAGEMESA